jgi:hypothetical protein
VLAVGREQRDQRDVAEHMGNRVAADQQAEGKQRRDVEPQQHHDPLVAPAPDVLGKQLPLGQPLHQRIPLTTDPPERADAPAAQRRAQGRPTRRLWGWRWS